LPREGFRSRNCIVILNFREVAPLEGLVKKERPKKQEAIYIIEDIVHGSCLKKVAFYSLPQAIYTSGDLVVENVHAFQASRTQGKA
jgi:hypothetical protein